MELTCLSGVTQVLTAPVFLFSITAQHVYINNTELRQQQCTVRFVQMLGLYTLAKFYQEICAMIGMRPGRTPCHSAPTRLLTCVPYVSTPFFLGASQCKSRLSLWLSNSLQWLPIRQLHLEIQRKMRSKLSLRRHAPRDPHQPLHAPLDL